MVKRVVGSIYSQEELDAYERQYDFALKEELYERADSAAAITPPNKGYHTKLANEWKRKATELRRRISPFGQLGLEVCSTTSVEFVPTKRKEDHGTTYGTLEGYGFGRYIQQSPIEIPSSTLYGVATEKARHMVHTRPTITLTHSRMVLATPIAEFDMDFYLQTRAVFFSGIKEGFALVNFQLLNEILFEYEKKFGSKDYLFYTHISPTYNTIAVAHGDDLFAVCMTVIRTEFEFEKLYQSYVLRLQIENDSTSPYSEIETE